MTSPHSRPIDSDRLRVISIGASDTIGQELLVRYLIVPHDDRQTTRTDRRSLVKKLSVHRADDVTLSLSTMTTVRRDGPTPNEKAM